MNSSKHVDSQLTHSLAMLTLALFLGMSTSYAAADDEPKRSAAAGGLPTPEKLLEGAIEAQGGKKAFDAIESVHSKAEMRTPMGNMEIETHSKASGEFVLRQSNPQMGVMRAGHDGAVGWSHNPMQGYQLLSDEEADEIRNMTMTYGMVARLKEDFGDMKTVERTAFAGADAYKVHMTNKKDGSEQHVFFHSDNHRLIGLVIEQESDFGPMEITMSFDEWEKRDDLTVFTKMTINQMGMEIIMAFTEIEFNNVDDAVFELPEEVKKLAAARQTREGDD